MTSPLKPNVSVLPAVCVQYYTPSHLVNMVMDTVDDVVVPASALAAKASCKPTLNATSTSQAALAAHAAGTQSIGQDASKQPASGMAASNAAACRPPTLPSGHVIADLAAGCGAFLKAAESRLHSARMIARDIDHYAGMQLCSIRSSTCLNALVATSASILTQSCCSCLLPALVITTCLELAVLQNELALLRAILPQTGLRAVEILRELGYKDVECDNSLHKVLDSVQFVIVACWVS